MTKGKIGKYSRGVSIIGVGATPFMDTNTDPELNGLTEGEVFGYAALDAMKNAGVEPRDVQFFYHCSANPRFFQDAVTPNMQVAEWMGMRGRGSVHHSEACCSGYIALEEAVLAVASGSYDVVLSVGVEMGTGLPLGTMPSCFRRPITTDDIYPDLPAIGDRAYARSFKGGMSLGGDTWIDWYVRTYGLTDRQMDDTLNMCSYQGRRAAALNELALLRTPFEQLAEENGYESAMEYLRSPFNPKISQYLRVTGNAPCADGAAGFIVVPTEIAHEFKSFGQPIQVLGIGASALDFQIPRLEQKATAEAARQVFEMTGVSPDEIDLFMTNDFSLGSQLLSAEECGYLPRGEGWKYVMDGRTGYDGDKPINTNGGRTSYGHAFGASGAADVYEAVLQMRGQAGAHQVKKLPKKALLRGFGGGQNVRAIILSAD